ncbi:3-hydroxyacyl-CoA dehydrogenase family protein [Agromyces archimandritae]|uniref:3-hydroxyacyl-CoA dehydrogenase family protein n=1 Tax=Agromyces archimandritae TaxID=2781962 RepID=A0A975FPQ7_9MICO|nr:3-hydroxyacyl-CoA dehydrogenase family protein [Agromyces archimandritae]QTX05744.1 3-hydroxyacyl-CoA dehydrogenase family protein [Agromyces archimandritae]
MSTPEAPASVGVLGGGRMGAGIAHAFLLAGSRVTVVERDEDAAEAASTRIRTSLEQSISRGTTEQSFEDLAGRYASATNVSAFAGCGLVVEAVPEVVELKLEALTSVESVLDAGAALATNTSSISIGELAAALERPARFLGMHFFNPVPASTLVELVQGPASDPALLAEARDWVRAIGKTPITVADAPGFASSRLGVALGLEAIRMLEDGVASAEDIDAAMTLGYKHPVGPLRLTDLVGLDVRLGIAEYLASSLGDRFEPPALLRRMVAEGAVGRKAGRGFYDWTES